METRRAAASRHAFATRIAAGFLLTRAILVITGFLALTQLPVTHDVKRFEIGQDGQARFVQLSRPHTALASGRYWMVNIFSRWDAQWYLDLAKHGYRYRGRGMHANTAFFPLYPALMAAGVNLFGHRDVSFLLAGMLISNISLLVALGYLVALARLEFDDETAERSALYLLVFPSTLFFSAVYTESLFLAAVVSAFYYARQGRWWVAGMLGAAATLTRSPGCLLFAALGLEYLQQRSFRWREVRTDVLSLALLPAALGLHFSYLRWKFGSFRVFFQSQEDWGRQVGGGMGRFVSFAHFSGGDFFVTLLTVISIVIAWRRLRPSYALYATLAFLLPLSTGSLFGMTRFCAVIFPLYLVLAMAGKNALFDRYWLILSSALAVLFMALFSQWHFVG